MQEQAVAKYGVTRRTICYNLKEKHGLKPGKSTFFSKLQEFAFFKRTIQFGQFGFPIDEEDLRHRMKNYLLRFGIEF